MFVLPFLLAVASASIEDCGKGNTLFTITDLSQNPPSSVATSQNVSLLLTYTVPSIVTGGTVIKSLTYNYIPFSPTEEDLCRNAECPLEPGEQDGSTWYEWPSGLSGSVESKVEWYDTNNNYLLCIESKLVSTGMKRTNVSGQLVPFLRGA